MLWKLLILFIVLLGLYCIFIGGNLEEGYHDYYGRRWINPYWMRWGSWWPRRRFIFYPRYNYGWRSYRGYGGVRYW